MAEEYIKKSDVCNAIFNGEHNLYSWEEIEEAIGKIPPIDVAPINSCEWVEHEDYWGDYFYTCSCCGEDLCFTTGDPVDNFYGYCPFCGARVTTIVRLEEQEDEDG